MLFQVAVELPEFRLQGIEFIVGLPQVQRRLRRHIGQAVDLAATSVNVPRQIPYRAFEVPQQFFRRPSPTTLSGDEQLSSQSLSTFPIPLWQDRQLRLHDGLAQRIQNRCCHSEERPFDFVGVIHKRDLPNVHGPAQRSPRRPVRQSD